jgi:hypothetical protein
VPGTGRPGHTPPLPRRGGLGAAMIPWGPEEDDVIFELGHLGAEAVSREIRRRCGTRRSAHAVEQRASRIHASLARRSVCPRCGAVGVRINKATGLCRLCADKEFLERARAQGERLEAERAAAEDPERIAEVRREWDAQRSQNYRTRKAIRKALGDAGAGGAADGAGGDIGHGGDGDGSGAPGGGV